VSKKSPSVVKSGTLSRYASLGTIGNALRKERLGRGKTHAITGKSSIAITQIRKSNRSHSKSDSVDW